MQKEPSHKGNQLPMGAVPCEMNILFGLRNINIQLITVLFRVRYPFSIKQQVKNWRHK